MCSVNHTLAASLLRALTPYDTFADSKNKARILFRGSNDTGDDMQKKKNAAVMQFRLQKSHDSSLEHLQHCQLLALILLKEPIREPAWFSFNRWHKSSPLVLFWKTGRARKLKTLRQPACVRYTLVFVRPSLCFSQQSFTLFCKGSPRFQYKQVILQLHLFRAQPRGHQRVKNRAFGFLLSSDPVCYTGQTLSWAPSSEEFTPIPTLCGFDSYVFMSVCCHNSAHFCHLHTDVV